MSDTDVLIFRFSMAMLIFLAVVFISTLNEILGELKKPRENKTINAIYRVEGLDQEFTNKQEAFRAARNLANAAYLVAGKRSEPKIYVYEVAN